MIPSMRMIPSMHVIPSMHIIPGRFPNFILALMSYTIAYALVQHPEPDTMLLVLQFTSTGQEGRPVMLC